MLLSGVAGVLFRRWCYVLVAGVGGGWCWGVRGAFGFGWWWWATQRSVLLRREEMPAAEQPQSGRTVGRPQEKNERGGAGVPPPPSALPAQRDHCSCSTTLAENRQATQRQ